eukprot:1700797-Ditylum_brightwellii.AAC.1
MVGDIADTAMGGSVGSTSSPHSAVDALHRSSENYGEESGDRSAILTDLEGSSYHLIDLHFSA